MTDEQFLDVIDCQAPDVVWETMRLKMVQRAKIAESMACDLEDEAIDKLDQSKHFHAQAQSFHQLATAIERAAVTFPAIAIEARSDTTGTGVAEGESAAIAQTTVANPMQHKD